MNTFGRLLRLTSFGESHGVAIGGILDGFPAGIRIDEERVQAELDRRKPGQSAMTTPRREEDRVVFLSGIKDSISLGTPIAFEIRNTDTRSRDYSNVAEVYRPSHADYTYDAKYGIRDYRGGGRASARETAVRVVGGALARQLLERLGVEVSAWTVALGTVACPLDELNVLPTREEIEASPVRCPYPEASERMQAELLEARAQGDSLGGVIVCTASGVPAGWGEPIYDKLSARLASAMLSINACRGFEVGEAFALAQSRGSLANDAMCSDGQGIKHQSNHSAGILGGISNGELLYWRSYFKPVASISQAQQTVSRSGEATELHIVGRHDPSVIARAVPVVEAMGALVLADMYLLSRAFPHSSLD